MEPYIIAKVRSGNPILSHNYVHKQKQTSAYSISPILLLNTIS